MGVSGRTRALLLAALALAAAAVAPACVGIDVVLTADEPSAPPVTASVLVEPSADAARWFRDVEVPAGTDGYELLEAVTEGDLEAEWFPEFRSHFVTGILAAAAEGSAFWGVFVWNETNGSWEPLPVGADLFSVKDGHVMGWALVEFDPDDPQLPVGTP